METPPENLELQSTLSLLEQVQGGNGEALDLLYRRYLGPLRRFARGRLPAYARDLRETDDLVQDTLLGTLHRLPDFEYLRTGGSRRGCPRPPSPTSPSGRGLLPDRVDRRRADATPETPAAPEGRTPTPPGPG